ncbi:MAG: bifunctional diaminohydroxyphosphoribosylaminopyrimidine deaminase/5-amino-6-(5-phosphoribosylamino)uracil reductase RibD [Planctomycetota bacterium]
MNGLSSTLDPALARSLLEELGEEARAFRFDVAPNPCVGAAILAGDRVVARGFHRVWGGPHAEIDVLARARSSGIPEDDWETLLVTLEPCSTSGKTPPCVDAILASPIQRVVVGALDPDPRHRGRGLEILRDAGLEVMVDPVAAPLERVSPHFLRWNDYERVRRPRPWTIAKWAQTLSGHLTPPADVGDGRWISGPTSLAEVHRLRSEVDAIVTGVGTVLSDDPRLTVRSLRTPEPPGAFRPVTLPSSAMEEQEAGGSVALDVETGPARVILDSWLRTPPSARLFESAGKNEAAGPVHVMALPGSDPIRRRALEAAGAHVHAGRGRDRHTLDLRELWTWLWEQGFERVLVEAGPTLLRNALDSGFVDQVRVYTGDVRGGEGESLASWLTQANLRERLQREAGQDAVLEAFLA